MKFLSNIQDGGIVPFIIGTQTATTGNWVGATSQISELQDGQVIHYWLPYNGSGNATLNLTLADGTTTGAINCYYKGTARITTHYSGGDLLTLIYRKNGNVDGTTLTGWWSHAQVSTNDYTTTEKNKLQGITAGATKTENSSTNGNIKINGSEVAVYNHPTGNGYHHTPSVSASNNENQFLRVDFNANSNKPVWAEIPSGSTTTKGIVKAGSSLTADNGTIDVKDDSHNHIIANVDGLQSALDSKYGDGSVIMNTNPFGGKKLYINNINNALFRAESRFSVTANIYNSDDTFYQTIPAAQKNYLFDGSYEHYAQIPEGKYMKVNITFNPYFPASGLLPYGDVYISHYFNYHSQSITGRVYCNHETQGIGWHELDFSDFISSSNHLIKKAHNEFYLISEMEFTITAPVGHKAHISQIEFALDRPGTSEMPFVDKYRKNKLYSDLDMNGKKLLNVGTPISEGDAVNKAYVDGKIHLKANTDNRDIDTTPNGYNSVFEIKGFKRSSVIGIPSEEGYYSGVFGMRAWGNSSGGNAHEFALGFGNGVYHRSGATDTWGDWERLYTTEFKPDGTDNNRFFLNGSGTKMYLSSIPAHLIYGASMEVQDSSGTTANLIAKQLISGVATGTAPLIVASTTKVNNLNADLLDGKHSADFAPLASPTFTGTPKAPTAPTGTNTTQIATTSFVQQAINDISVTGGFPYLGELSRSTAGDFNNLTTIGWYYWGWDSISDTMWSNEPEPKSSAVDNYRKGILEIFTSNSKTIQRFTTVKDSRVYKRAYNGASWSTWTCLNDDKIIYDSIYDSESAYGVHLAFSDYIIECKYQAFGGDYRIKIYNLPNNRQSGELILAFNTQSTSHTVSITNNSGDTIEDLGLNLSSIPTDKCRVMKIKFYPTNTSDKFIMTVERGY